MLRPDFRALEQALLAAEVAPRCVCRTIQELSDHFDDLCADLIDAGLTADEARAAARREIGTDELILAAVGSRTELRSWPSRWPRSAACLHAACYCAAVPCFPLVYCCHHGGAIARWSAAAGLAVLITGAMLFSMQLAVL